MEMCGCLFLPDRRNERAEYPYCQGRAYPSDHFRGEGVWRLVGKRSLRIFGVGRRRVRGACRRWRGGWSGCAPRRERIPLRRGFSGCRRSADAAFRSSSDSGGRAFRRVGRSGLCCVLGACRVFFSRMKQCHCRPEESGDRRKSKNRERMGARFGKREGRVCKYTLTKRRSQEVVVFFEFSN